MFSSIFLMTSDSYSVPLHNSNKAMAVTLSGAGAGLCDF